MVTVWNHKQICNHSFNTFVNYQRILLLIDFAVDWDRSMERNWKKNPRCKLLMRRPCLTSVTHSGQQALVYIVHNKIGQRGESTTRVHSFILTYRKSRILEKRTPIRINDKKKTTNCNHSCLKRQNMYEYVIIYLHEQLLCIIIDFYELKVIRLIKTDFYV